MKQLIEKLIADYKADKLTWHDIQDIVEARIMEQDGKGMTLDINAIHNRVVKENKILEEIERRIKEYQDEIAMQTYMKREQVVLNSYKKNERRIK